MPKKSEKRADGRYAVYLSLGFDERGKRIRKTFYGKTQKEANAKKKAYMEGHGFIIKEHVTLKEWAKEWESIYLKGGAKHKEVTESILAVFLKFMGPSTKIDTVQPRQMQAYAKSIADHSKSYCDKARRTLDSFFKTAVDNGFCSSNPSEGVVWDYVRNGTHKALEPILRTLVTDNWFIHNAGTWAMLMLYAGLRPSEALALRYEHVYDGFIHVIDGSGFEGNTLVIHEGKTKTESGQRTIPIVPPLQQMFDVLHAQGKTEGLICRNAKGGDVTKAAYRSNWEYYWDMLEQIHNGREPKGAGRRTDRYPPDWKYLPKVDKYDLRHTFCTTLFEADVDVKTAQYLMGHASLDMTLKIYTHLSEQKKERSYDKLLEHFSTGSQNGSQEI